VNEEMEKFRMATKQKWMIFAWLALSALAAAACSPTDSTVNAVTPQVPQVLLEETPASGVPMTGMEFDEQFINMMVPHHQGAVAMAEIAQQRGEHPEIKEMANAIVASQAGEITQMKDWKQQWYGSADTPPMSEMPSLEVMPGMGGMGHPMDMQAEVEALRGAAEPFDRAFIDAMIPHHQSAVAAAQAALKQSTHPEIQQMAQAIIDAQQKEIDQMTAWRQAWYP
jgi:uncharacterized protein (DUF305 family)